MKYFQFSNSPINLKKILIFSLIVFLVTAFTKQETIWLDKDLNRTSQSKATYYRVGEKLEGNVTYFFKNRTVFRKVFYEKGKLVGKFMEFYNTGELRETGSYENGLREGNWKVFYKNGKIRKKGKYSNGEKVGIWKTFYKNVYK